MSFVKRPDLLFKGPYIPQYRYDIHFYKLISSNICDCTSQLRFYCKLEKVLSEVDDENIFTESEIEPFTNNQ